MRPTQVLALVFCWRTWCLVRGQLAKPRVARPSFTSLVVFTKSISLTS
ncbi:Uncharacterised protein [Vibrio cholerae]|nr:Uncharacterised protein [Vibrio cholerae]